MESKWTVEQGQLYKSEPCLVIGLVCQAIDLLIYMVKPSMQDNFMVPNIAVQALVLAVCWIRNCTHD